MNLAIAAANDADTSPTKDLVITDFSSGLSKLGWYVVNDGVMGGLSEGEFELASGELRFIGKTNTNGGGFSSIRTMPVALDLSDYEGIRLKMLGDGRRYTWQLTTNAKWRGRPVSFWAEFDTRNGEWDIVDVPFSRFEPRFRGNKLVGPELDTGRITGMGLMIYDGKDGPFAARLASVRAYSAQALFSLGQYRWKNRVLAVGVPGNDDERLQQLRDEMALAPREFTERDMVLVILRDDGVSTAGERELTAEEAATARAELQIESGSFGVRLIGKDGSVKLSRKEATSLADIYALIDTMPMRQREKLNQR